MNVVLTVLVYASATMVISAMIAALVSFSSRRAAEAKRNETSTPTTTTTHVTIHSLPNAHYDRIDRNEYYIGVLIALWFAGVGIIMAPIGTGALSTLAESTQELLAYAMIIGSSLSLLGASLGRQKHHKRWNPVRFWFPDFREAHAYGVGAGGQLALGVALGVFGIAVLTNGSLIGTVTGLLSPVLSFCAFKFGRRLWNEHKRLNSQWWELRRAATDGDEP